MRFFLLFLFICPFFNAKGNPPVHQPDSAEYRAIVRIANVVSSRYIADTRTALFEVQEAEGPSDGYRIRTTEPQALADFERLLAEHNIPTANLSIALLPDSSVEAPTGIVHLSVANLRTAPRNQAELATQALMGTQVDLLQKRDGYYRVRTPEGYISWVNASSVTPKSGVELQQWQAAPKVIFTADFGHTYQAPRRDAMRVSDLVMGNILVAEGEADGFVRVRYPDGRTGYIERGQVRAFDEWLGALQPAAPEILDIAKTMMGLPYLWGGTSVKGVDCSGFTKTAYYMNGIVIPRDASQQVLAGLELDVLTDGDLDTAKILQNLQPADLLFFAAAKGRAENPRITHVALYMGNGEFIHSSGTVRINSLLRGAPNYDNEQASTFVAARRYLGQEDPGLQSLTTHPAYQQAATSAAKNLPATQSRP